MKRGRGLFRLWLVLSVCWGGATGAVIWWTLPADEEVPGRVSDDAKDLPDAPWIQNPAPSEATKPHTHVVVRSAERVEHIKKGAALAFALPLIVLVVGAGFAWVVIGFRP